MKIHHLLTVAALALASVVSSTTVASADPDVFVIESANGSEDVWTQSSFESLPVTGGEYRDQDRQRWDYDFDVDTLQNLGTGLCATAVDRDQIKGRPCAEDDPGQRWSRHRTDDWFLVKNQEFRTCALYTGLDNPLRLVSCNAGEPKQRWYFNRQ